MPPGRQDAPFLDPSPPPWAARGLAWTLLAIFAVAVGALVVVQIPESVRARFVVVPVKGTDPVRTLHNGIVTAVRVADAEPVATEAKPRRSRKAATAIAEDGE